MPGIIVHSLLTHVEHGARQAQVIQHESGTVTVRLVPGPEMDRVAAETLAQIVRKYLLGLPVSIQIVDAIEKGAGGKHRCVIVERPASQTSVEPQALPEVAEV